MSKKVLTLILAAALLAACLAGCGQKATVEVEETLTPQESETPAPATETPAPEEDLDPEEAARRARYQAAYETYAPDQTVFLVNGEPVTWAEYFSWVYDIATQMEDSFEISDWNATDDMLEGIVEDKTFNSYVCSIAKSYVVQVAVIGQKAKELDAGLTEAQQAEIQDTIDGYAEYFGGQEELEKVLSDSYLTMDYFIKQNEAMTLIDNIYVKLYGAKGEALPEEDALAYLRDNDYLYAKHILFKTVDDERNPLPEDQIAEKRAEAEAVLAELMACTPEELETRFDSLMQQYSEDTGLLRYPDGYYFQSGKMVAPFEAAAVQYAGQGLVPELVESDYGFHIMLCAPMKGDHLMEYDSNGEGYTPKAIASAALFDAVADEWYSDAEKSILYVNGFEDLDLNTLLGVS